MGNTETGNRFYMTLHYCVRSLSLAFTCVNVELLLYVCYRERQAREQAKQPSQPVIQQAMDTQGKLANLGLGLELIRQSSTLTASLLLSNIKIRKAIKFKRN